MCPGHTAGSMQPGDQVSDVWMPYPGLFPGWCPGRSQFTCAEMIVLVKLWFSSSIQPKMYLFSMPFSLHQHKVCECLPGYLREERVPLVRVVFAVLKAELPATPPTCALLA